MILYIFNKYGWILAVAAAFRKILSDTPRRPKRLWVGKSKELYDKHFKDVLGNGKSKIRMYSTESMFKSSVCEK